MQVAVNGNAERVTQRRDVLEVDLLLEILGAGGDEHALAAQDGGHEIGERLAGAGPGLGEQDAAAREHLRHRGGHFDLPGARLEVRHRTGKRSVGREHGLDRLVSLGARRAAACARWLRRASGLEACYSGYSGNFRHSVSTSVAHHRERAVVVGRRQRARDQLANRLHLRFAHPARGHRRRADADPARDHRRIRIERNGVLVDGDAGLVERRLGHLAGNPLREDVDEHQVVVGAAADEAESARRRARRQAAWRSRRSAVDSRRTPAPPPP